MNNEKWCDSNRIRCSSMTNDFINTKVVDVAVNFVLTGPDHRGESPVVGPKNFIVVVAWCDGRIIGVD